MILKNAKIVLEDEILENGYLIIHDNKIKAIGQGSIAEDGIDLKGKWILPGFIDCHVHGGYGVDFETGDQDRFQTFAKAVGQEGITKYLQASVTTDVVTMEKNFKAFGAYMSTKREGSICLGAHMEGPFIAVEKKGAHDEKLLIKPNIELTNQVIKWSNHHLKMITYAGDLQDGSFTKFLIQNKIEPSIGHTNMLASEFEKDYLLGAKHVTHLFNGMSGIEHQRPGLVVGAINHRDVLVEVISDGIHLQPEILRFIYQVKGAENICIITDAMNAKGLADGEYFLGQLPVIKTGMKVCLKSNGALAGAGATYDHNVRTMKKYTNASMNELIKMTSINIAKQLNIFDQTGSLAPNKLADLVVLDHDLNVEMTIAEGKIVYEK
ncbi:N-acetylglucosamine-6-phosphate deacetylase [Williamsoniiplasma luminosum]|uniref:N-acetylglucosamine-6-phosphate deacetylase n=1 Tax=Williamsoniiplasma luminosum TaxID=214888 RepID=A0A2S0NJC2_9MOLU|nr:N-acetylglucosamine-6-phosphate deacetylase [Williamsoniiplasma luminosum]AVP49120.1 MAG: N-acetylglucosamine-6-phosphate deacetylase [Williamsoniiplasma luminosum]